MSQQGGGREPIEISKSDSGAYEASVATLGNDLVVAWYDTRDGRAQIFARFVEEGRATGAELQLTRGRRFSYEPSLQLAGDLIIVGWYDKAVATGSLTARLGAWDRTGRARWQVRLSAAGREGRNPVVRVFDGAIYCAWLEGPRNASPSIRARWFALDGRPRTAVRRLAPASRTTWNLNAAIDASGSPWVVFDARTDTQAAELHVVRDDAAGPVLRRVSDDDGVDSAYPDIAFSGPEVAITWFDRREGNNEVYLFTGPAATLGSAHLDARARRVTETKGDSIGAYLAWNEQQLGLTWSDDTQGQYELFFQRFDARGEPGGPVQRLSDSAPWSLIPAITAWRDGFALAWNEYRPADKLQRSAARSSLHLRIVDRPDRD